MKELYEFINLFWKHIKKHIDLGTDPVNGDQEEVEILHADTIAIANHYSSKDDPAMQKFVSTCLVAFVTYLEAKSKCAK